MWVRLLSIISLLLSLMLIVCSAPSSPGPESASVALEFKSSNGKITQQSFTDTIGKQVTICLIHNIAHFIDASTLKITNGSDYDTVYLIRSFKGIVDTTYYQMAFSVPGLYSVNFSCSIDGHPTILNKTITIVDRPQTIKNQQPVLTLAKEIKSVAGQELVFPVSATDPDANQQVTINVVKKPESATFTANLFKWTPAITDTGSFKVIFCATDNGAPALSTTDSCVIVVNDNTGPTITPVSVPVSGTTVTTSSVDIVVSVSDPSEIDSVYWTKNSGTKKVMTPVAGKAAQYLLNESLTEGNVDTLTLIAVDKSTKHNQTTLTIILKFSEPRYSVYYKGNENTGGVVPTDLDTYVKGSTVTVASAGILVRNGYTFTGWNTAANGSGAVHAAGSTFAMGSANVTLYAQWTLIPTYTVTYNVNTEAVAGSVPVDVKAYTEGSQVAVKDAGSLSKTGFDFAGWNTLLSGNGTLYAPDASFQIGAENVTLYAKWTAKKCQINFNAHGGTAPESQIVDYGNLVAEPSSTLSGLTLVGWYSEQEYTNKWNFLTQKVSSSVTLHAKWAVMDIDGNVYDTVRIGSQTWMVQNLRTTKFNDGTPLTKVDDKTEWSNRTSEAFCWVNGYAPLTSICGLFYNHYAAGSDKIAPRGWHVPSGREFEVLYEYLMANGYNLKSMTSEDAGTPNNATNFFGYPSGWRDEYGDYAGYGEKCIWWTTTTLGIGWFFSPILSGSDMLISFYSADRRGINIRCIKDSN
jgi:uncharacterized protein (TIGR02145 family)/uncharacterized repeat protein (TIGR02543 family)